MLRILAEAQVARARLLEAAARDELDVRALQRAAETPRQFARLHQSASFSAAFAGSTFIVFSTWSVTSYDGLPNTATVESNTKS